MKTASLLAVLLFQIFAFASSEFTANRSYFLPEDTSYLSIRETNVGSLSLQEEKLVKSSEYSTLEISHRKNTQIDQHQYLIWNFIPVGMGFLVEPDFSEQLSAEWKINYQFPDGLPSGNLILSPNFTGKKKNFWNSFWGYEFVISYSYFYQDHPKPSFWNGSLKTNLIFAPLEKWQLGAYLRPELFFKGLLSEAGSLNPFPHKNIYTSGLWTEVQLKKTVVLQLEGTLSFFEDYLEKSIAKYSVLSTLGLAF